MDDVAGGLIVLFFGLCLAVVYVFVAGAALVVVGACAAVDGVAFFVWRVWAMTVAGVRSRGGDRRVVAAPEPAFEIYFGRPLARDFVAALGVAWSDGLALAAERRVWAFETFTGWAVPLAVGVTIGAYLGALVGALVGGVFGAVCGIFVLGLVGFVWVFSRLSTLWERGRRRMRGAHFDCPSCHERSPLPVYVCPGCGAKHHQLLPGRWGVRRRRCACDAMSLAVTERGGRHALAAECPRCQFSMPGASGIVPEIAVPIVGGPKAGKTAFLASLLLELDTLTQAGGSRLATVAESRSAFEQLTGDLRAGRVPAKTQVRDSTPAFVAEVKSGSRRSALLYAHDVAGELYQQADQVRDTPYLDRARGVVVLIDPFSLRAAAGELDRERAGERAAIDPSDENPQSVLERFLQALRESGRPDARKLPVAIVLSKADALPTRDGLSPGDQGDAVKRWLEQHGAGNLVRMVDTEFDRREYFAVSALGRLPSPSDTSAFAPQGTLSPFVWLLAANRIVLGTQAAETTTATAQTVTEDLSAKDGAVAVTPRPRTPILAMTPRTPAAYVAGIAAALVLFIGLGAALNTAGKNDASASYGYADDGASVSSETDGAATDDTATDETSIDDASTDDTATDDTTTDETGDDPADDVPLVEAERTVVDGTVLKRHQYSQFSILVPEGWPSIRREKEFDDPKTGELSYIETRWRDPGNHDVFALVDYTPGFAGSAEDGAEGVRPGWQKVSSYRERSYGAFPHGDDEAWRWSWTGNDREWVDYFLVTCDTGFAYLGSTPTGQFGDYRKLFSTMFQSFSPTC